MHFPRSTKDQETTVCYEEEETDKNVCSHLGCQPLLEITKVALQLEIETKIEHSLV